MSSEMRKGGTIAALQQMRLEASVLVSHSHFYMYTLQKVHLQLSLKIVYRLDEIFLCVLNKTTLWILGMFKI